MYVKEKLLQIKSRLPKKPRETAYLYGRSTALLGEFHLIICICNYKGFPTLLHSWISRPINGLTIKSLVVFVSMKKISEVMIHIFSHSSMKNFLSDFDILVHKNIIKKTIYFN